MLVGVIRKGRYIQVEDLPPEPERIRGFDIIGDLPPFVSPVDGSVVGSRRARQEHNNRNACIDVGNDPAAKRPHKPRLPTTDRELAKKLDETIGAAIRKHNPEAY